MIKTIIAKEIEVPEGVDVNIDKYDVMMKGAKGEVNKKLASKKVTITFQDKKIKVESKTTSKNEKKIVHTFAAHIKNMIKGCTEGYIYKLKVCSGHFPMNVSVSGDTFSVKNLFGEKIARVLKVKQGATVKVEGDMINVESVNKEIAGQVAADIEQLTKRTGFDKRIFQDGIYIINKAGKEIK